MLASGAFSFLRCGAPAFDDARRPGCLVNETHLAQIKENKMKKLILIFCLGIFYQIYGQAPKDTLYTLEGQYLTGEYVRINQKSIFFKIDGSKNVSTLPKDKIDKVLLKTGILLTASAFMFMGAKQQVDHIKAKSITLHNNAGKEVAYLGFAKNEGAFLEVFNKYGEKTGYFGTTKNNDGVVILFDRYGEEGWNASGKK